MLMKLRLQELKSRGPAEEWESETSGSSSSLEELREEVEGWEGAGDNREEGRPPPAHTITTLVKINLLTYAKRNIT